MKFSGFKVRERLSLNPNERFEHHRGYGGAWPIRGFDCRSIIAKAQKKPEMIFFRLLTVGRLTRNFGHNGSRFK